MDDLELPQQPEPFTPRPWHLSSLSELCAATNISNSRMSYLVQQTGFPIMVKNGKTYYDAVKVSAYLVLNETLFPKGKYLGSLAQDELQVEPEMSMDDGQSNPALERYRLARAQMAEIELAKMREELVEKEKFERDEAVRYAIAKNRLIRLPLELAGRLQGMTPVQMQSEMDTIIRDTLETLRGDILDNDSSEPQV